MKTTRKTFAAYLTAIFVICLFGGCSTLSNDSFGTSSYNSPMGGSGAGSSGGLYFEFDDVLVPNDMRVDKNATFITRTPNFAAGVLLVKGRIEMNSLITYFQNNMPKDGWSPITSFKSPRTLLLFRKDTRWCVVNIAERDFDTYAEIWVVPSSVGTSSSGGMGSSGSSIGMGSGGVHEEPLPSYRQ